MSTIFTKIVRGELPCYKIAENDKFLAFLDIMPLEPGHTLVIPKNEIDYIFDLDDNTLSELHIFSKKIALAIKKSIPCLRVGMAVVGLEVPHAHIHLVPLQNLSSINFTKDKIKMSDSELSKISNIISESIIY
jgi:histidine triad (HIT) family protein